MPQHVTFSDGLPTGAKVEASGRPNWHAFGMLVACSGAGIVILLCYILAVAHSLDAFKLAIIATWLLWLAYLAILARASLLRSNLWNYLGTTTLFAAWGLAAPLLVWGVGQDLQMMRGYPAVEAMIVSCVNIFMSCLSLGGVVAQHALFLSVVSMELWARSPSTETNATAVKLMVTAANFSLGISSCCLLCLAHNRQTSLTSPPAAAAAAAAEAGAAAEGHADKPAAADARPIARAQSTFGRKGTAKAQATASTQVAAVQERETKNAAGQGHSSMCAPLGGLAFSAVQPTPSLKPSAHLAPSGFTTLVANLCYNASLLAWVQRVELWLLAAVPQEEAKLLAGMLSAVFVGTRFLTSVANYAAPGIVAMSPTMDVLAIVLGMLMGGSPDMQGWASAQLRAYRSVRGLLRNIMPAHVADALEAYEAEREPAWPTCAFGVPSRPSRRHSFNRSRRTSYSSFVGSSRRQSSSCSTRASYNAFVGSSRGQSSTCSRRSSNNAFVGLTTPFSERHEQVTVLFADIVGFTTLSEQLHPSEVMNLLGDLYKEYDERAVELGLYTVDTIGDCYMCAANLVKPLPDHVHVMVGFARSIIKIANVTLTPLGTPLSIRVGIHTGPLMSGVIGVHRLKFTLLGDTVIVASRMETTAITNTLQISEHAYKQLRREQLAMLSKAAEEQSSDTGGRGSSLDMHSQKRGTCLMVRGNSAPPCLLASMQAERGTALIDLGCSIGSSTRGHGSKPPNGQEQQPRQPHAHEQQFEEQLQQQQQGQGHECQDEDKQQCCLNQPEAQGKGGQNKSEEPQSLGGEPHILSQGAVTSSCTAAPAEQSSHMQQPGGLDQGPAQLWLERKLHVKGKGVMKAYTYIGP